MHLEFKISDVNSIIKCQKVSTEGLNFSSVDKKLLDRMKGNFVQSYFKALRDVLNEISSKLLEKRNAEKNI